MKKYSHLIISLVFVTLCQNRAALAVTTPKVTLPSVKKFETQNNIEVFYIKEPHLPYFQIDILIRVGSQNDPQGQEGMAYLVAKMLKTGSLHKKDLEFHKNFQRLGAYFNVTVDTRFINIQCSSLSSQEQETLALCLSPLLNPHFSESIFKREKEHALNAIKASQSDPEEMVYVSWKKWYFGKKSPYGSNLQGTPRSLKSITLEDLKDFYYNNISFEKILIGLVSPSAARGLVKSINKNLLSQNQIQNHLKNYLKHKEVSEKKSDTVPSQSLSKRSSSLPEIHLVHQENVKQAYFIFSYKMWDEKTLDDEEYVHLRMANEFLGGGSDSLLFQKIREEQGLTYSIYSYIYRNKNEGHFYLYTFTGLNNTRKIIKDILSIIKSKTIYNSLTETNLKSLKNSEKVSFSNAVGSLSKFSSRVLVLQTPESYAQKKDFYNKYINYIETNSITNIKSISKKYLRPKNLKILVYGPKSLKKALKPLGKLTMEPLSQVFQ